VNRRIGGLLQHGSTRFYRAHIYFLFSQDVLTRLHNHHCMLLPSHAIVHASGRFSVGVFKMRSARGNGPRIYPVIPARDCIYTFVIYLCTEQPFYSCFV